MAFEYRIKLMIKRRSDDTSYRQEEVVIRMNEPLNNCSGGWSTNNDIDKRKLRNMAISQGGYSPELVHPDIYECKILSGDYIKENKTNKPTENNSVKKNEDIRKEEPKEEPVRTRNCENCSSEYIRGNGYADYLRGNDSYNYYYFCSNSCEDTYINENNLEVCDKNGFTAIERAKIEKEKEEARLLREHKYSVALKEQRKKIYGSEEDYYDNLTQKLNKSSSNKNCFIATAVYKDIDHPVIIDLRHYRDRYLNNSNLGKIFIQWYYKRGPMLAKFVSKSKILRLITVIFIIKPIHLFVKRL
jgi:hypothetical protein